MLPRLNACAMGDVFVFLESLEQRIVARVRAYPEPVDMVSLAKPQRTHVYAHTHGVDRLTGAYTLEL